MPNGGVTDNVEVVAPVDHAYTGPTKGRVIAGVNVHESPSQSEVVGQFKVNFTGLMLLVIVILLVAVQPVTSVTVTE